MAHWRSCQHSQRSRWLLILKVNSPNGLSQDRASASRLLCLLIAFSYANLIHFSIYILRKCVWKLFALIKIDSSLHWRGVGGERPGDANEIKEGQSLDWCSIGPELTLGTRCRHLLLIYCLHLMDKLGCTWLNSQLALSLVDDVICTPITLCIHFWFARNNAPLDWLCP